MVTADRRRCRPYRVPAGQQADGFPAELFDARQIRVFSDKQPGRIGPAARGLNTSFQIDAHEGERMDGCSVLVSGDSLSLPEPGAINR